MVKLAKGSEHAEAHATDTLPAEIPGQSLQQLLTILRPVFAALLEFDDVGADEPVAENKALVDRRRRAPDRRGVGLRDGREELAVVHGRKFQ